MGQLKPVGSEKLQGDEKLNRILELTYYQTPSENSNNKTTIKETTSGVYGIVKEKDGFYVKKGINEDSLDYIGGLFMKNKNRFSSHNEAVKKMEFLVEQEKLVEATKYVLKQPKPNPEPMSAPEDELPMDTPDDETPSTEESPSILTTDGEESEETPFGDEGQNDGDDGEDESDYLKIIQKLTGKLTQKLSTFEDQIKPYDIKYVINMVLSSVDLGKLDQSDIEDIVDKIENFEDESSDDMGNDNPFGDEETDDLSELEDLINRPLVDDDDDFEEEDFNDDDDEPIGLTDKTKVKDDIDFNQEMETNESQGDSSLNNVKELDINELTDMVNKTVKETLSKYFEA